MEYFGHIKDDDTSNRILYVEAIDENEARTKIKEGLARQKRWIVLYKWEAAGEKVRPHSLD